MLEPPSYCSRCGASLSPSSSGVAGKPIKRTFPTRTAAKQWREDANVALRAGSLTSDRGPTLNDALDRWLALLSAGAERTRSGDPYKPGTVRDYERCIRRYGVRDALGHVRVRELRTSTYSVGSTGSSWRAV